MTHQPATILVVEDDADIRDAVVETLQSNGYRVLSAHDGVEALSALGKETSIDLMFSDVVMPHGMSGVDLMREAQRLKPSLRIMLTSGYSSQAIDGVVARLRQSGRAAIDVPEFKEMFGLTRRLAIPLLEHLDQTKVTRRVGDRREIVK